MFLGLGCQVHSLYPGQPDNSGDSWGAIASWAWGAQRHTAVTATQGRATCATQGKGGRRGGPTVPGVRVHRHHSPSQSIAIAGYSRCMDYFETVPDLDHTHVAAIGHSRKGKTALWAGATQPQLTLSAVNTSTLSWRGSTGEWIVGEGVAKTDRPPLPLRRDGPPDRACHLQQLRLRSAPPQQVVLCSIARGV